MLVVYDAFCYFLVGTNIASNFLWANGIKLFKVREETVKLMGRGDIFLSPICPPLSEDAQKALDWALDEKLKSGNLLLMFSSCCGFPVSLKSFQQCVLVILNVKFSVGLLLKANCQKSYTTKLNGLILHFAIQD